MDTGKTGQLFVPPGRAPRDRGPREVLTEASAPSARAGRPSPLSSPRGGCPKRSIGRGRVRPVDGTVAGTDTNLAYPAAGDPNSTRTPRVVAVAYTNPDVDLQTNTVLHDLDVNRAADADPRIGDVLAIQVPPNGGVLNTVGRLGIDADDFAAFDIGPDNEALAAILSMHLGSPSSRAPRRGAASQVG
jgi:hypothetical protein